MKDHASEPDHGWMIVPFCVVRHPLLPVDEFLAWSGAGAVGDDGVLDSESYQARETAVREHLRAVTSTPHFREALFLASPDLHAEIPLWLDDPASSRGRRIESALVRYFTRMTTRPTPFGLFAGVALGRIGPDSCLILPARSRYVRSTQLDSEYTSALFEGLQNDPRSHRASRYRLNSSLHEARGRFWYAERVGSSDGCAYNAVAVASAPELCALLDLVRVEPRSCDELEAVLHEMDVDPDEASAFVSELIASQILVSDLLPSTTGARGSRSGRMQLSRNPATAQVADRLTTVIDTLAALDGDGIGQSAQRYIALADTLRDLPAPLNLARLFQVDVVTPAPQLLLGEAIVGEIQEAVQLLSRMTDYVDPLARFKQQFAERYEQQEVPLLEALDADLGLALDGDTSHARDASALLRNVPLLQQQRPQRIWAARDEALQRLIFRAIEGQSREVVVTEADVARLASQAESEIPVCCSVAASIAAASAKSLAAGDYLIVIRGVQADSGMQGMGRFCGASEELSKHVREFLLTEGRMDPDRIYAEIVHVPQGRLGNVISRPLLRQYEIPYLGISGAPESDQIPVTDLTVSLRGGRLVLRSLRHGKEVVPRLTCAHTYNWNSLPVYQFLASLQSQGHPSGLSWDWGCLQMSPFTPRIRHGRVVLARAHWKLAAEDFASLPASGDLARFRFVQGLRQAKQLPRRVAICEADNELVIDLDNPLSVACLLQRCSNREIVDLVECFPDLDACCLAGPEGRFTHQVIVPLSRAAPTAIRPAPSPIEDAQRVPRHFPPGSEWMYLKAFTGAAEADALLVHRIVPLIGELEAAGVIDQWHFLRYADPRPHLRVRLHGQPAELRSKALEAIGALAHRSIGDRTVHAVELDTYCAEIERYGGRLGHQASQEMFHHDSATVAAIIARSTPEDRWLHALIGIDRLLADFGYDAAHRLRLAHLWNDEFRREFGNRKDLHVAIGARYRGHSELLLSRLTEGSKDAASQAFERRSARWANAVERLRRLERDRLLSKSVDVIVTSLVHLHVNRMLRANQRAHERVLYDYLERAYRTLNAVSRRPEHA